MPTNDSELPIQARRILDAIAFTPFEQCQPLNRGFGGIPARPGIYAIRHKTDGLLYVGHWCRNHFRTYCLILSEDTTKSSSAKCPKKMVLSYEPRNEQPEYNNRLGRWESEKLEWRIRQYSCPGKFESWKLRLRVKVLFICLSAAKVATSVGDILCSGKHSLFRAKMGMMCHST